MKNLFTRKNVSLFLSIVLIFLSFPTAEARDKYSNVKLRFGVGDALPALQAKTTGGQAANLSDFVRPGRKTVVVVWATWCPACARVMPHLEKMRPRLERNSVTVVGVNVDLDRRPPIADFYAEKGIGFQTLVGDVKTANSIFVTREVAVPLVIFVNERGKITDYTFGWSDAFVGKIDALAR